MGLSLSVRDVGSAVVDAVTRVEMKTERFVGYGFTRQMAANSLLGMMDDEADRPRYTTYRPENKNCPHADSDDTTISEFLEKFTTYHPHDDEYAVRPDYVIETPRFFKIKVENNLFFVSRTRIGPNDMFGYGSRRSFAIMAMLAVTAFYARQSGFTKFFKEAYALELFDIEEDETYSITTVTGTGMKSVTYNVVFEQANGVYRATLQEDCACESSSSSEEDEA